MIDEKTKDAILNSLKNPVAFCDLDHIIQYMNNAAIIHYSKGKALLGTNVLDCHNEVSQKMMLEIFEEMKSGLDEKMITDNTKYRIYMRAIRDEDGRLIGYFERYEPPVKSA